MIFSTSANIPFSAGLILRIRHVNELGSLIVNDLDSVRYIWSSNPRGIVVISKQLFRGHCRFDRSTLGSGKNVSTMILMLRHFQFKFLPHSALTFVDDRLPTLFPNINDEWKFRF